MSSKEKREKSSVAKSRKRFLPSLALLATTLLLLECLMRLILPLPEIRNFNRIDYSQLSKAPHMAKYTQLRNVAYWWISEPDNARFRVDLNLYGFRTDNWPVKKTGPRIIFMGDSFVEGLMAAEDDTIPATFERVLEGEAKDLEVLNLGVAAAGFTEYIHLLADAISLFEPDHLILVLYSNDMVAPKFDAGKMVKPLEPVRYSPFIPRMLEVGAQLRQGTPIAFAWQHRPPFQFLAAVPDRTNPWTAHADTMQYVRGDIAESMRKAWFNPFAVDELNTQAARLARDVSAKPYLSWMKGYAAKHGCVLSIVYIPSRHQVSDYYIQFAAAYSKDSGVESLQGGEFQVQPRRLAQDCNELKLPHLDMTDSLKDEEQERHLYWDYDEHMRGEGYRLTGGVIARWWQRAVLPRR